MNNINNAVDLLEKAKAILHLRSQQPKKPGDNFNIFAVLQLNEVDHCRMLFELLDPKGSHGMGDCFLRSFFDMVLKKPYSSGISVYREKSTEYGRIDLLIEGIDFCYPIEVKVHACDQQTQLARYDKFAAKRAKEHKVYYLTLDSYDPSEQSRGNANVDCLSFARKIREWLLRCGEIAWRQPAIAEIIRQYIKLLDELTGNVQEDIYMQQIRNEIKKSQINFESAVAIANSLPIIKTEMMKRVFAEIEKHMEGRLIKFNSDYQDRAIQYCQSKIDKRKFPGVAYCLTESDGKIAALRFEVDWDSLYMGVTFYAEEKHLECSEDKMLEMLAAMFPAANCQNIKPGSKHWLWWKYLPAEDMLLNFNACNGIYPQLYDENGFNNIMKLIFAQIDGHLDHIIETGLYEESL